MAGAVKPYFTVRIWRGCTPSDNGVRFYADMHGVVRQLYVEAPGLIARGLYDATSGICVNDQAHLIDGADLRRVHDEIRARGWRLPAADETAKECA